MNAKSRKGYRLLMPTAVVTGLLLSLSATYRESESIYIRALEKIGSKYYIVDGLLSTTTIFDAINLHSENRHSDQFLCLSGEKSDVCTVKMNKADLIQVINERSGVFFIDEKFIEEAIIGYSFKLF